MNVFRHQAFLSRNHVIEENGNQRWTQIDRLGNRRQESVIGSSDDSGFSSYSCLLNSVSFPQWLLILFAAVLLFSSGTVAFASTNAGFEYNSRVWQTDDGLPGNSVQALAQTTDGYLWIGTTRGLARFDGVRFTRFDFGKSAYVTALGATRDGSLWASSRDGVFQYKDGKFAGLLSTNDIGAMSKALVETRDGSLWIATFKGVVRYHDKKFTRFARSDGLLAESVFTFCETSDGLWIGTFSGLNQWREGSLTTPPPDCRGLIQAVAETRDGSLWLGLTEGVTRVKHGGCTNFKKDDGLAANMVTALCADRRGNLWIGTSGGLNRLEVSIGQAPGVSDPPPVFLVEKDHEGNVYDSVNVVMEDAEGNIWVGAKDGLHQLKPRRFLTYAKQQGLSHNNVMAVLEDRQGTIWASTWGGGLNQWRDGKFSMVTAQAGVLPDDAHRLSSELLLGLREDRDGVLWIGADYDSGVFTFKEETFTRYGNSEGMFETAIRVIAEDAHGNIWLGASTGLSIRSPDGKFSHHSKTNGLAGNIVRCIFKDHNDVIWIGTNEGLSREKAPGEFENLTTREGLSHNTVISICEDRAYNLWLGTGGGLTRIKNEKLKVKNAESGVRSQEERAKKRRKGEKETQAITNHESRITEFSPDTWHLAPDTVRSYTTKDGLFSDEIFEILEDDFGYLWMSCLQGIFRVTQKDFDDFDRGLIGRLHSIAYGKADGLLTQQCNGVAKPSAWKGRDGRLWFATTKGIAVVDSKTIDLNTTPPPVMIEEIIADKKRIQESGVRNQEPEKRRKGEEGNSPFHLFSLSPFLIPPGRGELEFHYTALSFSAPEKNRFRYRIESVDSDWVDAGTRRVAYYNLKPGRYTFQVQACNSEGIWNSLGANMKLTLQPHYWQSRAVDTVTMK